MESRKESLPNFKKGWTKNWSGRGTAILDDIEMGSKTEGNIAYKEPSISKKLEILIESYPYNKFYADLYIKYTKGYKLSDRQIQIINDNYFLKIYRSKTNS